MNLYNFTNGLHLEDALRRYTAVYKNCHTPVSVLVVALVTTAIRIYQLAKFIKIPSRVTIV